MSEERSIDGRRIERAVREILLALGEDPGRFAEAYAHLL
jgi:GTP cyclohydrolase I